MGWDGLGQTFVFGNVFNPLLILHGSMAIYPVHPLRHSKELLAFCMDGPIEVAPIRVHVSWFVLLAG